MQNLKKKTNKNPLNTFSIVYFLLDRLFTDRLFTEDSVSPRTNTIASRGQFKPIRIGENLVVNYNGR